MTSVVPVRSTSAARGVARSRSRRRGAPPVLVAGGAAAGIVAVLPLVYLVVRAWEAGPGAFAAVLARPRTVEPVSYTHLTPVSYTHLTLPTTPYV